MLLRAVVAAGGLTFIATGFGVLLSNSCRTVVWGSSGSERAGNFTATCHDAAVTGGMSQGVAALISFLAGTALLLLVFLPAYLAKRRETVEVWESGSLEVRE